MNSSTTLAWGTVSKCRPTPFRASVGGSEHGFWIHKRGFCMAAESLVPTSISAEHANDTTYDLYVRQPDLKVVQVNIPLRSPDSIL